MITPNDPNEPKVSVIESIKNVGQPKEAMASVEESRAIAKVQAAIAVAKKFPRDEDLVTKRLKIACGRGSLADQAIYDYGKGGAQVTGPSIRLAEAMAQAWGNFDCGVVEVEKSDDATTVMSFAHDLETNYRVEKVFSVPHERYSKAGGVKKLTEGREIYEVVADKAARRLRACILAVIPGHFQDLALIECEATVKRLNDGSPLKDRIKTMVEFMENYNVTPGMIQTKFGKNVDALSETDLGRLRKMAASIKDGMAGVADFFGKQETAATEVAAKLGPSVAPAVAKPAPAGSPSSLFTGPQPQR